MPDKKAETESVNWPANDPKNLTPREEAHWLRSVENRLFHQCRTYLNPTRFHPGKKEIRFLKNLKRATSCILAAGAKTDLSSELHFAFAVFSRSGGLILIEELCRQINGRLEASNWSIHPKRIGRKSPPAPLAYLLYAALEWAKGNRRLLKGLGETIRQNGPLHKRIDSEFFEGAFDLFKFPGLDHLGDRWERGPKASLKPLARICFEWGQGRGLRPGTKEYEHKFASALNLLGYLFLLEV